MCLLLIKIAVNEGEFLLSKLSSKTLPPTGQTMRVFDNRIYLNDGYDKHIAR